MLQNGFYQIEFNEENGGVSVLSLRGDKNRMNFCKKGKRYLLFVGFSWKLLKKGIFRRKPLPLFKREQ